MVIQEKDIPKLKAYQTQGPHVCSWRHASTRGTLLEELILSDQLGICQRNYHPNNLHRYPYQVCEFFLKYSQAEFKLEIFMGLPIGFGFDGYHLR